MPHILDNPIFNALQYNHKNISYGTAAVKCYHEDFTAFAGFETYSPENFETLHSISNEEQVRVLFTPTPLKPLTNWEIVHTIDMYQMIFDQQVTKQSGSTDFTELDESHVLTMSELVELTKPGPFLSRTIELGNYIGIFKDKQLVSMLGQRLKLKPYVEISAVCTHPDHLGKGYARVLLNEQVKRIVEDEQIPFLHVKNDNVAAIKLYEKAGFKVRAEMFATVLKKK